MDNVGSNWNIHGEFIGRHDELKSREAWKDNSQEGQMLDHLQGLEGFNFKQPYTYKSRTLFSKIPLMIQ